MYTFEPSFFVEKLSFWRSNPIFEVIQSAVNARSYSVNGVKVSHYLPVRVASKVHVVEAVRSFLAAHMLNFM